MRPVAACNSPIPGADPRHRMPSSPRLSVIMPVYGVPEYLAECLDSVLGQATASGGYVWFADADDMIAAGAVAQVTAALAQDRPDVLLIDYEDFYAGGATGPSPGGALLRAAPAGAFALAAQPALINLAMTAWSKVIRREF